MKIQLKGKRYQPTHRPHPWSQKVSGRNVGVSQRNTVLNRNRRLLLWGSQKKKDVNDVNLQITNECFLNNIHVIQITK